MALYLREDDVRQVLTWPLAIDAVTQALRAHARGAAFDVPRHRARLPTGHLHLMQAAAPELGRVGFKVYYGRPGKRRTSQLHLLNLDEGRLDAIVEADWLGQMRTAAASALAMRYLARESSSVLGLFGAGRHAETQLEAACAALSLREARVYARDADRATAFCERMRARLGIAVHAVTDRADVLRGVDIVLTMTTASQPLFEGQSLEPGQLIVAVGSNALDRREIDLETVRRADVVVVDSRAVAERESGDLLPAIERGLVHVDRLPELGEIVAGLRPGRSDPTQIILFESHGMAIEDVYTGTQVVALARQRSLGIDLPID